jgi:large subunit ribosomal protein L17
MRHRVRSRSFARKTGPRVALYRGLVTELLRYEKIRTTLPKAREIRPIAEKAITLAKRGDLHARRLLIGRLFGDEVVDKAIHVLGPRFADRPGGYTRIVKLGKRIGDNADMAVIELVE